MIVEKDILLKEKLNAIDILTVENNELKEKENYYKEKIQVISY
jgi:hypothetical protein